MLAIAGKATFGLLTVGTATAKLGLLASCAIGSTLLTAGAGMGGYAINEAMNGREIDTSEMVLHGILTGFKGGVAFMTGMALATGGAFNYLIKGLQMTFQEKFKLMLIRSSASFVLQFPWKRVLNYGTSKI